MGFKRYINWSPISGSYFLNGSILEKCGHFWKKRADMARLGKYCTGGYGRIGVYRVSVELFMFDHLQYYSTYNREYNVYINTHSSQNIQS